MEEEEVKESRKCAGSGTLDRSEKFGQDRDTLGFPRSTSSGRFGNDRVYGSSRSFKGVFRILPLLIEFARKMYLYLKYLEFVQKDLYTLFEKKNCLNPRNNVSSNTNPSYKSPHRYSALLSSPSLVKTFPAYFKFLFLANPLPKRQFLGRTISNRSASTQKNRNFSFSLFPLPK